MKGDLSLNMVTAATMMGSVKSAGLCLLLLSFLLYVVDSYPNIDLSNMGCEECTLRKNSVFSRDRPVYQCMGCCFSRAYPTPLKAMRTMTIPKNITSEATCCVAKHSYEFLCYQGLKRGDGRLCILVVLLAQWMAFTLIPVKLGFIVQQWTEVAGIRVRNHTDCHCSTCFFHKI